MIYIYRVSEFFYKVFNPSLNFFLGGGGRDGGMGWLESRVSEFCYKASKSKKEINFFFFGGGGGRGWGRGVEL